MVKNDHMRRVATGLFFIVGLILIAVCVFLIGVDRGLAQPKFQTIVLFHEVGGLIEGGPIRLSGVNVGVVGDIDFLDQPIEGRSLKVNLIIFKKYELQFRKCSRISIKTEGVLGQKLIEISEDHRRDSFDLTKPLIGEDPLNVEDMAGVITKTALSVQSAASGVNGLVREIELLSRKTRKLMNHVDEKLLEGDLFKIF